jgi:uncharacterized protein YcbX
MAQLARITVFPIKSLDGVCRDDAEITAAGSLRHDRRWAMQTPTGEFLNGKRFPAVHRLRAEFDLAAGTVRLRSQQATTWNTFHFEDDRARLATWLSDFFAMSVTLVENRTSGFPDDTAAPGPTILSTQTLQQVAAWFDLPLDETRRRFRANLEIDADAAFWEDQLFTSSAQGVAFQIGDVSFLGTNPCARCVVPSRSADTGEPTPQFQKQFAQRRQATLPPWSTRERFDHFYRLAVNTKPLMVPHTGAVRVGDAVRLL